MRPLRFPLPSVRSRSLVLAVLLTAACLATAARAQTPWIETGDAGDLIATAQHPVGTGPLLEIDGALASATDVDVYCIRMTNVPPVGLPLVELQCVANLGPNVALFDAMGNGVFTTTVCSFGNKLIQMPSAGIPVGTYYVAVSYSGLDPQSAGGAIWQAVVASQRAPDGPGAAGTLTGWAGTPLVSPVNPYVLRLAFMEYCDAATPAGFRTWGTLKQRYR